MMKRILHLFLLLISPFSAMSQSPGQFSSLRITEKATVGSFTYDPSAILTIASTDKGLLPPRMTTAEKLAINSPSEGLLVYDTDLSELQFFSGGWFTVGGGGVGDMLKSIYDTNADDLVDNADSLDGEAPAFYLARGNHTGTQTASTISDFDTEVGNQSDVAANTADRHDAVTLSGTPDYITLSGQDIVRGLIDLSTDITGTTTATSISDFDTEVSNNASVTANTAKVTNVTTNLSEGTTTTTTVDVNSSDGTNATLVAASDSRAGVMTKAKFDEVVVNNAKVTNATHTGDVTGSGALTIANKAVEIVMLDDGVDGELITWDAAGVAATVSTGSAGEILTSNGAGAAPTFEAASGADGDGIYDGSGSLSGTTTVTMATNNLTFASTGEGNLLHFDNTNSRIGVGISATMARMHIKGIDDAANFVIQMDNSTGSPLFHVRNDKRVSVNAAIEGTAIFYIKGVSGQDILRTDRSTGARTFTVNDDGNIFPFGHDIIDVGRVLINKSTSVFASDIIDIDVTSTGTTAPDATNSYLSTRNTSATDGNYMFHNFQNEDEKAIAAFGLQVTAHATFKADFVWRTSDGVANITSEKMRLNDIGNLGIGVIAPLARLNVRGENAAFSTLTGLWEDNVGTDLMRIANNGSVSIGTDDFSSSRLTTKSATNNTSSFSYIGQNSDGDFSFAVAGNNNIGFGTLSFLSGHKMAITEMDRMIFVNTNATTPVSDFRWQYDGVLKAAIQYNNSTTPKRMDFFVGGVIGSNVVFTIDSTNHAIVNGKLSTIATSTTLGVAATTFAITSNVMTMTGDGGGNTLATITGANSGTLLTMIFTGGNITITDDNTHAANSVDLSAAFTSLDDTVLMLVFDGTSWYQVAPRSDN